MMIVGYSKSIAYEIVDQLHMYIFAEWLDISYFLYSY